MDRRSDARLEDYEKASPAHLAGWISLHMLPTVRQTVSRSVGVPKPRVVVRKPRSATCCAMSSDVVFSKCGGRAYLAMQHPGVSLATSWGRDYHQTRRCGEWETFENAGAESLRSERRIALP